LKNFQSIAALLPHHIPRVTVGMKEDLKVWLTFLSNYNGTTIGSLITILIVSNYMPKNTKTSVGSTVLSSAKGIPHTLQDS
jgi:hypothetical protein